MISSLCWVPRGAAKRKPERFAPSAEEAEYIKEMAEEEQEEEIEELGVEAPSSPKAEAGLPAELDMDNYDEEDETLGGVDDIEIDEVEEDALESDSDEEDDEIRKNDALLLVARTEEDYSLLEVYLFDESIDTLYVHHDISLPAFPLALSWMDCPPLPSETAAAQEKGNFVAVGTFKPGIEIWNLDVMDVFEPVTTLGGETNDIPQLSSEAQSGTTNKKKKKKKKKLGQRPQLVEGSHTDAVMALDWNRNIRNLLASGSADSTVKVWDLTSQKPIHTFQHHKDKVQGVTWNPAESTILASGSFDRTVSIVDGRQPDKIGKFNVAADVESLSWNPSSPVMLLVTTEDGMVRGYDIRGGDKGLLYSFSAHTGACSSASFSHGIDGMLATAGVDKTVKVWDIKGDKPACIASRQMGIGEVFTVSFYVDSPFVLAAGGSKGTVAIWDTEENRGVQQHFSGRP